MLDLNPKELVHWIVEMEKNIDFEAIENLKSVKFTTIKLKGQVSLFYERSFSYWTDYLLIEG